MCNCVQFTPVNIYNWMLDNRKIHIISEMASNIMRYYYFYLKTQLKTAFNRIINSCEIALVIQLDVFILISYYDNNMHLNYFFYLVYIYYYYNICIMRNS